MERDLDRPVELTVETRWSGPMFPDQDRFARGETDLGFLCAPSYHWLSSRPEPSVVLVPLAPVFDDERAAGRPVYFSDVLVRASGPIARLDDLAGRRVGYNDRASLSGYRGLLDHLQQRDVDPTFFGRFDELGGHRRCLEEIVGGQIDAAAVDANVRLAWEREDPARVGLLRSVATIGPHPIQPLVIATPLADGLLEPLVDALGRPSLWSELAPWGVTAFAPVDASHYESIRHTSRLSRA
jgi:ABC-type phosphate/phosphonate transport system substrate-binding protein